MRCLSGSVLFGLLIVFGLARSAGAQDAAASLAAWRKVYRDQEKAFEKIVETKRADALKRYLSDLRSLVRYMEKTGDDFGLRPVNAELMRFKAEQTVPRESAVGTPELLKKARARYNELIEAAQAHKQAQMETLTQKYVARLRALRERYLANASAAEAAGNPDAARIAAEIARVSSSDADSESQTAVEIRLPRQLYNGLWLAYTFDDVTDRHVPDLSGRRRHGQVMGARTRVDPAEGAVCEFKKEYDAIELERAGKDAARTISARVYFPLAQSKREHVLASGGFGRDHIVVDARDVLGLGAGGFMSSRFNVGKLKGWHDLTVVCGSTRAVFYLDGKAVGTVDAACREPLKIIGNSEAGGRAWCGPVSSFMAWSRPLSAAEVKALVKALRQGK